MGSAARVLETFVSSGIDRSWIEVLDDRTLLVDVPRNELRNVVSTLRRLGARPRTMAACDDRSRDGVYRLLYVYAFDDLGTTTILSVALDPRKPVAPTVIDVDPALDWYELEAWDLMGIEFEGRKLRRLILPEDWPSNLHPLRKDVSIEEMKKLYKPLATWRGLEIGADSVALIPVGPYHPALHEPELFVLYLRGEKVVDIDYLGFMVHRGIEKLAESMTYDKVPFIAERICGICGYAHSVAYCQAVEHALRIEVPDRARYIRTLLLEVERIHSHLLWIGVACHLLGFDTGFMHTWRIREKVMVLAEKLTGSRKMYGINIVGGVRMDIDSDKLSYAEKVIEELRREVPRLISATISVPQVRKRLSGTGILEKSDATRYAVVGPTARGSGVPIDVRKDHPYAAYGELSFRVPTYSEGDNMARTMVRVEELEESFSIVEQTIDALRKVGGWIANEEYEIVPGRLGIGSVEAPRGEDIHVLITDRTTPYRWRVRAPTYQNLPALRAMLRDCDLADAPLTIASIDPCFSCTDRILILDLRTGGVTIRSVRKVVGG